jgi:uncharacterized protein
MIGAVLDTNVLVSALLSRSGPPAIILRRAFVGSFRCIFSDSVLAEYEGVLYRRHLNILDQEVHQTLRNLRKVSFLVKPSKRVNAAFDASDNKFLECALEARADYVVTGNLRHFPSRFQDIRIVDPRQFLTILATQL